MGLEVDQGRPERLERRRGRLKRRSVRRSVRRRARLISGSGGRIGGAEIPRIVCTTVTVASS